MKVSGPEKQVALKCFQRQWFAQHLPLRIGWEVVSDKVSWVCEQEVRVEITPEFPGLPVDVPGCPRQVNQVPTGSCAQAHGVPFMIWKFRINGVAWNIGRRLHYSRNFHCFDARIPITQKKKNRKR